jgi:hypothetical protein
MMTLRDNSIEYRPEIDALREEPLATRDYDLCSKMFSKEH